MEVDVDWDITSPNPERGVCRAARNDYYSEYVGDEDFDEIMESINGVDISEKMYHLLTNTLLKKEHYGPFEHPQLAITIKGMSRVTMAQITRHRHMSFDIQSQRYVDFDDADIAVPKSLTDSEHFSREDGVLEVEPEVQEHFEKFYGEHCERSVTLYNEMVKEGIPKEDARFCLPLGTKVNVYMSGNLRSFMHVLNMRGKADAQWEIRELTDLICEELDDWAPMTAEYFEQNGPFKLGM